MSAYKTIVVPTWAFDAVAEIRTRIMVANETGLIPAAVQAFIREKQLRGEITDPYARGAIIGIACLLATQALERHHHPALEPAKADQRALTHTQEQSRTLVEIDGDVIAIDD